jgi:DNA-binding MarR family transcriptional regulator
LVKRKKPGRGTRKGNGALDFGVLDTFVGFQLHKARNVAATELRHELAAGLLPGYFPILYLIDRNPGRTQSAIAHAVGLDRSSLVPILNRFERRGWLARTVAAGDRRAHALELTESGRAVLAGLAATVSTLEARISGALGADGQPEMLRLLHRFQAAFDGD